MFTVKLQRISALAPAEDVVSPCLVEAVARTEQYDVAEAFAQRCHEIATTLRVWIEFDVDLPN